MYAVLFGISAALLGIRECYGDAFLGKTALAGLGWISYMVIESYGSILVAFFWSFCNSISDPDSAEQGFPFIISMAQISAIVGSSLLYFPGSQGSLCLLMLIASGFACTVIPLVRYFMNQMRHDPLVAAVTKKDPEETNEGFLWGAFEGIYLLLTRPYLFGILLISVIYDAVSVIFDYQMNTYASSSPLFSSESAFAQFQSMYGIGVSLVSLIIALFITSSFLKRFGSRVSLLVYPLLFTLSLAALLACFYSGISSGTVLWVFFGMMMGVMIWIAFSQLLGPIKDATSDARSVSQLDCDNSSITTGNKATCVVIDFMMFGFAGAVIAIIFGGIGGGLISKRIKKE